MAGKKRSSVCRRAMTKKVVRIFRKKIKRVTPSLAALGDIDLSDATDSTSSR